MLCIFINNAQASHLPSGFVYLNQIDSTIVQHLMYYGDLNFMGRRIDGYKAPKVIVTEKAALHLKMVQDDLRNDNYSLVIYDAYRPQKAVEHVWQWSQDLSDQIMKPFYYPYIDKRDAFKLGYIARKSGHTRGSTVDLTIIKLGETVNPKPRRIQRTLRDGRTIFRWQDNTVDMFTSVDLMDTASYHDTDLIDEEFLRRRNYLRSKMQAHHFQLYPKEWWHYTLINEPFNNTYFDFDVE